MRKGILIKFPFCKQITCSWQQQRLCKTCAGLARTSLFVGGNRWAAPLNVIHTRRRWRSITEWSEREHFFIQAARALFTSQTFLLIYHPKLSKVYAMYTNTRCCSQRPCGRSKHKIFLERKLKSHKWKCVLENTMRIKNWHFIYFLCALRIIGYRVNAILFATAWEVIDIKRQTYNAGSEETYQGGLESKSRRVMKDFRLYTVIYVWNYFNLFAAFIAVSCLPQSIKLKMYCTNCYHGSIKLLTPKLYRYYQLGHNLYSTIINKQKHICAHFLYFFNDSNNV